MRFVQRCHREASRVACVSAEANRDHEDAQGPARRCGGSSDGARACRSGAVRRRAGAGGIPEAGLFRRTSSSAACDCSSCLGWALSPCGSACARAAPSAATSRHCDRPPRQPTHVERARTTRARHGPRALTSDGRESAHPRPPEEVGSWSRSPFRARGILGSQPPSVRLNRDLDENHPTRQRKQQSVRIRDRRTGRRSRVGLRQPRRSNATLRRWPPRAHGLSQRDRSRADPRVPR